jgi:AmmeMemoRadiSam system protein B
MPGNQTLYPKLRTLDIRPLVQDGQPCILLRDPLQLSDKMLVVPQPLGLVLSLCDGTREDARAVSGALALRFGLRIAPSAVDHLLNVLDEALLLENASFARARQQAVADYRQAPFRPLSSAGHSYPPDAGALRQLLQNYTEAIPPTQVGQGGEIRGLVSPHIDYARGGPVYAQVWQRAAKAVKAAELAVILGTDHASEDHPITLTRQHYATPFGVLPTARAVVDELAEAVGQETAFASELNHRGEHSIELAAIWLHHVREGQACELVPILCGSFDSFNEGATDARADPAIERLVSTLKGALDGRRAIVVAAGDLAHVGPAFGGAPLDVVGRGQLRAADDELVAHMCQGNAKGFLDAIRRVNDRNNVCGVPPIYTLLRLLAPSQGECVAYERCPADEDSTSVVSICGVVLQ